uniref:Uncharacterized protein n=1 Tax=Cebus imitator TaxID=2715852 RepID=A0A2K5QSN0_CEBIM
MDSRFPDFQELDLEPERACQDVAGTLETTTEQALPPALLLGIRRPEFLSRPSVQTEDAPSKANYAYRPYRPGTWIFAEDDSYHLTTEEDTHSIGPL